MFCSSCGAEYAIGLNYCNRCGANLNPAVAGEELAPISVTKPAIVLGLTMMTITLGGFAAIIEGATKLGHINQQNDPVIAIIVMGMITIMVADILLLWQLSRLITATVNRPGQQKKLPKQKGAKQIAAPAPGSYVPVSSVTDHTTRTLNRQPVERT